MKETRITTKDGEKITEGYFLTMKQLKKLVKDYNKDNSSIWSSKPNTKKYIETWIKNNENE